jgi:glucosamine--fructose-6-phosphate aminotransferase (isomerizing)
MDYMLKEILQQPSIISKIVKKNFDNIKKICEKIKKQDIRFIEFVARGSSDNACMFGKYFLEYMCGIPTGLMAPSLFSLYNEKTNLKNVLVFGVSQSGQTPEILEVLKKAKKCGAYTIGITNNPKSDIINIADDSILLNAGKEQAVPATKTYTAQLAVFYMVGFILSEKFEMLNKFVVQVPKFINEIFDREKEIKSIAEQYRFVRDLVVLGRGLNFSTAMETALKLKETCYVKAEALSASDFLHGPIAMIGQDLPVIIYAPKDPTFEHLYNTAKRLKEEFNAEMLIISTEKKIAKFAKNKVLISKKVLPLFSPIVYIVVGQLFAYYLAKSKNINPDNPRGLRKVTIG